MKLPKNVEEHLHGVISDTISDVLDRDAVDLGQVVEWFSTYDPAGKSFRKYTNERMYKFLQRHPQRYEVFRDSKHPNVVLVRLVKNAKRKYGSDLLYRPPSSYQEKVNSTGSKPIVDVRTKFVKPLPRHKLPLALQRIMTSLNGTIHEFNVRLKNVVIHDLLKKKPATIHETTSTENYNLLFHTLLHLEELQMEIDIQQYDLFDVEISENKHLIRIEVPGLAENRPSVLRSDTVFLVDLSNIPEKARRSEDAQEIRRWNTHKKIHQGFAHFVNLDHVLASFDSTVDPCGIYDVQFTFTRTPLRVMHRAVDGSHILKQTLLDPSVSRNYWEEDQLRLKKSYHTINGLNNPKLNKLQREAIDLVVIRKPKLPVVLFGPPGTGKTTALVEMIHQILHHDVKAKILACTPSNEAADLICSRLHLASPLARKGMIRLNGMQRNPKTVVDQEVMNYCSIGHGGSFVIPCVETVAKATVVISTLVSSSYIYSMGLEDHYTHVIIDECGQAIEPETIIPLLSAKSDAQVLFCGDPKQLGPIIRSPLAIEYRLDRSLLERILEINEKHPCCHVVQLRDTYRAHPAILSLYSTLFYGQTLVSKADPQITHSLLPWFRKMGVKVPILFKHVDGVESRTVDSPSWFNVAEITEVLEVISNLLGSQLGVKVEDIGVISPYRKQVERIKQAIHRYGAYMKGIQVGTVELFQGKQKKIIIISSVRSQAQNLHFDEKFKLGFLKNPKRLNVAISRAQAALLMFGNANILSLDPEWKKLLEMCKIMGAYKGPRITLPQIPPVNKHSQANHSRSAYNADSPWRQDY